MIISPGLNSSPSVDEAIAEVLFIKEVKTIRTITETHLNEFFT
jgi:hypothetical protein